MATNDQQTRLPLCIPNSNASNISPPPLTANKPNAQLELEANFKELRKELDRKEQEMISLLTSSNNSNNFLGQFVWHKTNFTRALDNICELELAENECLNISKPSWQKCNNGIGRNQLQGATSISFDHIDSKLYVADRENGRMSIFDKDGHSIRIRSLNDLRSNTPVPELLIFDPSNRLIWVYASDSCINPISYRFVAFDAGNLSEKFNVEAIPGVITLSLALRPNSALHYFTYNMKDHSIKHGYYEVNGNDIKLVPCDGIYLESHYLEDCRRVLGLQTLKDYIFVLYRDIEFRILKFDMSGNFCESYLSEKSFAPLECFCLLSLNCFLLARIGPSPIKQDSQQNILSPVSTGAPFLQICIVSSEGTVKDQLALPITPVSEDYEEVPVPCKCSQLLVSNSKLFILLRGCDLNLIAF